MRTTITLDDDVASKLAARSKKTGQSFKRVVNEAIRNGLAVQEKSRRLPGFKIAAHQLASLEPGLDYDKVEELFDELDGIARLR